MSEKKKISPKYQIWINTRELYKLTDEQIQMARELGYNPKKIKRIYEDETLMLPLPNFIETEYRKKFNKVRPDNVLSIEEEFEQIKQKSAERKK